ncbi:MAG: hypothetical protein ACK4NC_02055 [Candidatus Gracilibacteria bacterium]
MVRSQNLISKSVLAFKKVGISLGICLVFVSTPGCSSNPNIPAAPTMNVVTPHSSDSAFIVKPGIQNAVAQTTELSGQVVWPEKEEASSSPIPNPSPTASPTAVASTPLSVHVSGNGGGGGNYIPSPSPSPSAINKECPYLNRPEFQYSGLPCVKNGIVNKNDSSSSNYNEYKAYNEKGEMVFYDRSNSGSNNSNITITSGYSGEYGSYLKQKEEEKKKAQS